MVPLFQQLTKCVSSPHFQVVVGSSLDIHPAPSLSVVVAIEVMTPFLTRTCLLSISLLERWCLMFFLPFLLLLLLLLMLLLFFLSLCPMNILFFLSSILTYRLPTFPVSRWLSALSISGTTSTSCLWSKRTLESWCRSCSPRCTRYRRIIGTRPSWLWSTTSSSPSWRWMENSSTNWRPTTSRSVNGRRRRKRSGRSCGDSWSRCKSPTGIGKTPSWTETSKRRRRRRQQQRQQNLRSLALSRRSVSLARARTLSRYVWPTREEMFYYMLQLRKIEWRNTTIVIFPRRLRDKKKENAKKGRGIKTKRGNAKIYVAQLICFAVLNKLYLGRNKRSYRSKKKS